MANLRDGCSTFTSVGWLETEGRIARRLCGSSMLPIFATLCGSISSGPFSGQSPSFEVSLTSTLVRGEGLTTGWRHRAEWLSRNASGERLLYYGWRLLVRSSLADKSDNQVRVGRGGYGCGIGSEELRLTLRMLLLIPREGIGDLHYTSLSNFHLSRGLQMPIGIVISLSTPTRGIGHRPYSR
ncbi:hypothetical protein H5410_046449 [Solanum commersonii]|uniref:Uncharacterized protein n=1 Tax=Solanum commersonii TaxID=4109 RepID=A0A9J5XEG7_SOLCO|nr:hypothetical protein H5410_046449 [Solanum commersonii]